MRKFIIASFMLAAATLAVHAADLNMVVIGDNNVAVQDDLATNTDHACNSDPTKPTSGKPCLTLSAAAHHALLNCYGPPFCPDEKATTGEEKYRRWKIANKLEKGGSLDHDELELVRKLIGEMYSPIVVGAVFAALDGDKK